MPSNHCEAAPKGALLSIIKMPRNINIMALAFKNLYSIHTYLTACKCP